MGFLSKMVLAAHEVIGDTPQWCNSAMDCKTATYITVIPAALQQAFSLFSDCLPFYPKEKWELSNLTVSNNDGAGTDVC